MALVGLTQMEVLLQETRSGLVRHFFVLYISRKHDNEKKKEEYEEQVRLGLASRRWQGESNFQ